VSSHRSTCKHTPFKKHFYSGRCKQTAFQDQVAHKGKKEKKDSVVIIRRLRERRRRRRVGMKGGWCCLVWPTRRRWGGGGWRVSEHPPECRGGNVPTMFSVSPQKQQKQQQQP